MENLTAAEVRRFYREIIGIQSGELLSELERVTRAECIPKGTVLSRPGEPQTSIPFLHDGLFRCWVTDETGKQITRSLAIRKGDVLISNFDLNGVSLTNTEALADSRVLRLPKSYILDRMATEPEFARAYQQLLGQNATRSWIILAGMTRWSASERYDWFCREYPGLIETVNNRYIASFLGITTVTLSRLRHGTATKSGREEKEQEGGRAGQNTPDP